MAQDTLKVTELTEGGGFVRESGGEGLTEGRTEGRTEVREDVETGR